MDFGLARSSITLDRIPDFILGELSGFEPGEQEIQTEIWKRSFIDHVPWWIQWIVTSRM